MICPSSYPESAACLTQLAELTLLGAMILVMITVLLLFQLALILMPLHFLR